MPNTATLLRDKPLDATAEPELHDHEPNQRVDSEYGLLQDELDVLRQEAYSWPRPRRYWPNT